MKCLSETEKKRMMNVKNRKKLRFAYKIALRAILICLAVSTVICTVAAVFITVRVIAIAVPMFIVSIVFPPIFAAYSRKAKKYYQELDEH